MRIWFIKIVNVLVLHFSWKFDEDDHAKYCMFHRGSRSRIRGFPCILWQKLLKIGYCLI
jgi:hypothetical protein